MSKTCSTRSRCSSSTGSPAATRWCRFWCCLCRPLRASGLTAFTATNSPSIRPRTSPSGSGSVDSSPPTGSGPGFAREALERRAAMRSGRPFDPTCLTEDYETGFEIHAMGCSQVFVPLRPASRDHEGAVATREYFPRSFKPSISQRCRGVTGIALQGAGSVTGGAARGANSTVSGATAKAWSETCSHRRLTCSFCMARPAT